MRVPRWFFPRHRRAPISRLGKLSTTMTKLGLISDPHANPTPVAEALALFAEQGVDAIWCTGDIAGYGCELEATVRLLLQNACQVIRGNHELWLLEDTEIELSPTVHYYLASLPAVIDQEIEGRRIYMVHASPPHSNSDGIRLLDQHGQIVEAQKQYWTQQLTGFVPDVLVVGHTHQVFAEYLADTLVINPGSSSYNHSCAVLSLPGLHVQWFALSDHKIIKSWNWGEQFKDNQT